MEHEDAEAGVPRAELALPVLQRRDRCHDKRRLELAAAVEAAEVAHELDRFAEAHLIAHDACAGHATCSESKVTTCIRIYVAPNEAIGLEATLAPRLQATFTLWHIQKRYIAHDKGCTTSQNRHLG